MVLFLEKLYGSTESDDVAALLGSMMVLGDGGTADPAIRREWVECVDEVLRSRRGYSGTTFWNPTPEVRRKTPSAKFREQLFHALG